MFSEPDKKTNINWNTISSNEDLDELLERSKQRPQLIYKHSTICSFSRMAQGELISAADEIEKKADINYVGVIETRPLSNKVSQVLGIRHESPQIILVKNGEAIWDASHGGVKGSTILQQL